jgi:hypothetical protein
MAVSTDSDIHITRPRNCLCQLRENRQAATTKPPTTLLSLPSELRNKIFELALVRQNSINPWNDWDQFEEFTVGLLRTNRTILREASSIFYTQNHFDFTMGNPRNIASFLEQIGSNNASYIRHICIEFPTFRSMDLGNVVISEDSRSILADIHRYCTNLGTLTTSLYSTNAAELDLEALDNNHIVDEAIMLVHAAFRALPSTPEIILEVYKDGPSGHTRDLMRSHGWTINETEHSEEEDDDYHRGLSDDGMDYSDNYSDEDYADEYDIHNDSDFWRRAGD